jgi:hypothetical protein
MSIYVACQLMDLSSWIAIADFYKCNCNREFRDVTISNMSGSHSPNSKDKYDIRLFDGYGFRLFNSESNGIDPVVERNNVNNK